MSKNSLQPQKPLSPHEQRLLKETDSPKPYNDPSLSVLQNRAVEIRTVFVDNIPAQATKKEVYRNFKVSGAISKIWIKTGTESEVCKTKDCYILFKDNQGADNAVIQGNNKVFQNRHLRVTKAGYRETNMDKLVLLADLPENADEEVLRAKFQHLGTVLYVRLLRSTEDRRCNGFGYIMFNKKPNHLALLKGGFTYNEQSIRAMKMGNYLFEKDNKLTEAERLNSKRAHAKLQESTDQISKMKNKKEQGVNPIEKKRVHTGKVPNTILVRKIKKMRKKRGMTGTELAENAAKLQKEESNKINKQYLLKDDLLKARRELRKKKKMYNKLASRNSHK